MSGNIWPLFLSVWFAFSYSNFCFNVRKVCHEDSYKEFPILVQFKIISLFIIHLNISVSSIVSPFETVNISLCCLLFDMLLGRTILYLYIPFPGILYQFSGKDLLYKLPGRECVASLHEIKCKTCFWGEGNTVTHLFYFTACLPVPHCGF